MTTHANTPERARGFTLIEVLAALVIVALGMMGAIEAVSQSARNGMYLRDKTFAHWIAMNIITDRRLQANPPDVGETSDEVDFAGRRWKWTLQVTQTQLPSMRRMDVLVRVKDAPADSSLVKVSGFYGTAVGAAGGSSVAWAGTGTKGQSQTPSGTTPAARQTPSTQPVQQP